ncbi:MAG: hypothetical protein ACJA0X_000923 [Cyclobacteriaceae bacterium]
MIYVRGIDSNVHTIKLIFGDIELTIAKPIQLLVPTLVKSLLVVFTGVTILTSGDHLIKRIEGNIECGSTSGNLAFVSINGKIEANARSGDMDEVEGDLSLRSTSGEIQGSAIMTRTFANL